VHHAVGERLTGFRGPSNCSGLSGLSWSSYSVGSRFSVPSRGHRGLGGCSFWAPDGTLSDRMQPGSKAARRFESANRSYFQVLAFVVVELGASCGKGS
jgi:hypothetical protein